MITYKRISPHKKITPTFSPKHITYMPQLSNGHIFQTYDHIVFVTYYLLLLRKINQ